MNEYIHSVDWYKVTVRLMPQRLKLRKISLMRLRWCDPMKRYIDRQWRYNRRIVCIHGDCMRMIGDDHVLYCNTHAARYE